MKKLLLISLLLVGFAYGQNITPTSGLSVGFVLDQGNHAGQIRPALITLAPPGAISSTPVQIRYLPDDTDNLGTSFIYRSSIVQSNGTVNGTWVALSYSGGGGGGGGGGNVTTTGSNLLNFVTSGNGNYTLPSGNQTLAGLAIGNQTFLGNLTINGTKAISLNVVGGIETPGLYDGTGTLFINLATGDFPQSGYTFDDTLNVNTQLNTQFFHATASANIDNVLTLGDNLTLTDGKRITGNITFTGANTYSGTSNFTGNLLGNLTLGNGMITVNYNGLASNNYAGLDMINNTAATFSVQSQSSPELILSGMGLKTTGNVSQQVDFSLQNFPNPGSSNATSTLYLNFQVAGNGYNSGATLSSAGDLKAFNSLVVGGAGLVGGNLTVNGTNTFTGANTFNGTTTFNGNQTWLAGTNIAATNITFNGTTPLSVQNVTTAGVSNSNVSLYGSFAAVSNQTLHYLGINSTADSDVLIIQQSATSGGHSVGQSAIDFMSSTYLDDSGNRNGIMGAVGFSNAYGDILYDWTYLSFSPGFIAPNFTQPVSSGVGQFQLSREGHFGVNYVRSIALGFPNDWSTIMNDPDNNRILQISSPLSSSGNYDGGDMLFKIIGTADYAAGGATGGGADATFLAQSNSTNFGFLAAYNSQYSYHAYPASGAAVVSNGSGGLALMATNGSGPIKFYTGGDNTGQLAATIFSSGNIDVGNTTSDPGYKLRVEGTFDATGAATFGSTVTASGLISVNGGATVAANNAITISPGTTSGQVTLVTGQVYVATAAFTNNCTVFTTAVAGSGTEGALYISNQTIGTGFNITSTSLTDNSTVNWKIMK